VILGRHVVKFHADFRQDDAHAYLFFVPERRMVLLYDRFVKVWPLLRAKELGGRRVSRAARRYP
jgi:hypothetical protein